MRKFPARVLLASVVVASAALVVVSLGSAQAAGVPCQRTYSSGSIEAAIGDLSAISFTIDVPEDGRVPTDVDVQVDIHHTYVSDLSLGLVSLTDAGAARASLQLFNHRGGNGDNLLGTVFDDSAPTLINDGTAPFTGRFVPDMPLATITGLAGGKLMLQVSDSGPGDTGVVNNWSVTFFYASCDLDQDGVEDEADGCPTSPGATASGCPIATRAVTARFGHGKFKGTLTSSAPGCSASRSVTVWKVRGGPDRRIGTVSSRSDGSYRLARARHRGRYYATSPGLVAAGAAVCPAARSTTFRVR